MSAPALTGNAVASGKDSVEESVASGAAPSSADCVLVAAVGESEWLGGEAVPVLPEVKDFEPLAAAASAGTVARGVPCALVAASVGVTAGSEVVRLGGGAAALGDADVVG